MEFPKIYPVRPVSKALKGQVICLPGSKSLTNRALIMAALCPGVVTLEGALFSRDTELMLAALRQLKFLVKTDPIRSRIVIEGQGGHITEAKASLHVGNAGTVARFLTAFLCLRKGGIYELDGDSAMRERPMKGLLDALSNCGAASVYYHGKEGHFPFTLKTHGLKGGAMEVDAQASSQILSALLMVAPLAAKSSVLHCSNTRKPFVAMTLALMRDVFGLEPCSPLENDEGYNISNDFAYQSPHQAKVLIEPDITAASYFAALPIVAGGSLLLQNLATPSLQGDEAFLTLLESQGLLEQQIESEGRHVSAGSSRQGISADFSAFSDTFLTLAAIAPLLDSSVRIMGIGHTRHQETDRIAGMAKELKKLLGADKVIEEATALTLHPNLDSLKQRAQAALDRGTPLCIETYEDHRFAMSFAVLGSYDLLGNGEPWLHIHNPGCCTKTFPQFFTVLEGLHG